MAKSDLKKAAPAKSPAKKAAKAPKAEKVKRPPSAYNLFMKSELAKVKAKSPELNHKEAFTAAANNWKNSSANPNKVK